MKSFNKGLFSIEPTKVLSDEYAITMYSEDYETQLMLFADKKDLMELKNYLDELLKKDESRSMKGVF